MEAIAKVVAGILDVEDADQFIQPARRRRQRVRQWSVAVSSVLMLALAYGVGALAWRIPRHSANLRGRSSLRFLSDRRICGL
jgi:hypothetical protein